MRIACFEGIDTFMGYIEANPAKTSSTRSDKEWETDISEADDTGRPSVVPEELLATHWRHDTNITLDGDFEAG